MDLLQLLAALLIVGICSTIASWILRYTPGGVIMNIIVGVVGAYLGGWLYSLLPFRIAILDVTTISIATTRINIFWTIIGSLLMLTLLYAIRNRETRNFFIWNR
jgi:uncharacterized membrane protein YeaQ/YmgE (transglycosylase-associated protein family)